MTTNNDILLKLNKESHFFCFIANNIEAGIRHTKTKLDHFEKKSASAYLESCIELSFRKVLKNYKMNTTKPIDYRSLSNMIF